jgi:pimeloyl-ACP methyl ester carboxylesterase
MATELAIETDGATLAAEQAGEPDGPPVVLLHGLTASRRYVVMGSRILERSGHRVVTYDARGHGRSSPAADPSAYGYSELADDLGAVLDWLGIGRAVLAGVSMGAHTLLRFALSEPARVAGLVVITPAYDGSLGRLERWDALAQGLRSGGVEGFLQAYGRPRVADEWVETVVKVIEQRMALHEHPEAVADALSAVPRSRPFGEVAELGAISVPVTVIASGDAADPDHPQAVGEAYAATIPGATLLTDPPGASPLAWQGSQVSKLIAEVVERAGL